MHISEVDSYFRNLMAIDDLAKSDVSLNGLQVTRREPKIDKIAFSVDACLESFRRASSVEADMLFVHHGLFWGRSIPLRGAHYERLRYLLEEDIALYAVHLPLDMHSEFGNNFGMARAIGLTELAPFGDYHGIDIGVRGLLPAPMSLEQILDALRIDRASSAAVLPFGTDEIRSVAIVSGGATDIVDQAIDLGLDLFVTGDGSHTVYHTCLEEGINLISGGHYQTEVWGVSLLAEKTARETGLETCFIDIPTGL